MSTRTPINFLLTITASALFGLAGCRDGNGNGEGTGSAALAAGERIFDERCVTCHTIGQGVRKAPDLREVHKRRSKEWLTKWVKDPEGMIKTDPDAKKLAEEWSKVDKMQDLKLRDEEITQVLAFIEAESLKPPKAAVPAAAPAELSQADFEKTKDLYFNRCAGCHGTLRKGATGPNIEPARAKELGVAGIEVIMDKGTPGGMPPFGKEKLLTKEQIKMMAAYLQQPAPEPPQRPLEAIKASWNLMVPVEKRVKSPQTKRDWQNYFGVVMRDAGKVAIVDGNTKDMLAQIDTGFAVHILRSSSTGRYFYAVGRDGLVTLIDLWPEVPQMVAQVQGCFDARSVDGSKHKGYEDKLIIEGCYWPPQYVVMDGLTLEPKAVVDVTTPAYDTKEELKEVRVAAIVASHHGPYWVAGLKESGHVAVIDYSKPGFPIASKIPAERFLHDGGWDHTHRYFMIAANMRNQMVVIDVKNREMVAKFETGIKPHPGRGANWEDPEFGWVNATPHIGEGKLSIYGADPVKNPKHAWKVVREVKLPSAGGLFVKTHPKSAWVWMDAPLGTDPGAARQICAYSKKGMKIEKCWPVGEKGRAVHFEYDKEGTEVWVSVWDKEGELIVYDDRNLEEKTRITGDWVVTPTGKFNVNNTANDVY